MNEAPPNAEDPVAATILRLAAARGPAKSICPSEAARALAPEGEAWNHMMPRVRAAALGLARAGAIEILRKGKPVPDLAVVKGVIRLRIKT